MKFKIEILIDLPGVEGSEAEWRQNVWDDTLKQLECSHLEWARKFCGQDGIQATQILEHHLFWANLIGESPYNIQLMPDDYTLGESDDN